MLRIVKILVIVSLFSVLAKGFAISIIEDFV